MRWNHHKIGFSVTVCWYSSFTVQWNTSGQASVWPSFGTLSRSCVEAFGPRIKCRPSLNQMKNMVLRKTEGTVVVIGAGKEWHGSHQGKSETTTDFNHTVCQQRPRAGTLHSIQLISVHKQSELDSDKTPDPKWYAVGSVGRLTWKTITFHTCD